MDVMRQGPPHGRALALALHARLPADGACLNPGMVVTLIAVEDPLDAGPHLRETRIIALTPPPALVLDRRYGGGLLLLVPGEDRLATKEEARAVDADHGRGVIRFARAVHAAGLILVHARVPALIPHIRDTPVAEAVAVPTVERGEAEAEMT